MQHNYADMRHIHVNMQHGYTIMQDNYEDMQYNFKSNVNITHVYITMLQININILHVDNIYLECKGQKYATILLLRVIIKSVPFLV